VGHRFPKDNALGAPAASTIVTGVSTGGAPSRPFAWLNDPVYDEGAFVPALPQPAQGLGQAAPGHSTFMPYNLSFAEVARAGSAELKG